MWRRYMSTTQDNESAAAQGITIDVGLRAVLQYRYGVVNAANPLTEGAKVLGYENEYDMVFQLLTAGAGAVQKKKAVKGTETTDDAKVPDENFVRMHRGWIEDMLKSRFGRRAEELDDLARICARPSHVSAEDSLLAAAEAVVERWDTPLWKDAPATAGYINALRAAVDARLERGAK